MKNIAADAAIIDDAMNPEKNDVTLIINPVIKGPDEWPISIIELSPPREEPSFDFCTISAK